MSVYATVILMSFLASAVGAICGIGGGIIIKPCLDALGVADVATASFLSGCTVFAMTSYSVLRAKWRGTSQIDGATDTPLAVGAAAGGLVGKRIFTCVSSLFANPDTAGAIQAALLVVMTLGTLVYTLNKDRVTPLHLSSPAACVAIGFALGTFSSFLGIGGGPFNLAVLFYFFGMDTKRAAQSSLYIILLSQTTSLASVIATGGVGTVDYGLLAAMVACGLAGGIAGGIANARLSEKTVSHLFVAVMVVIIAINVSNVFKFALA